MFGSQQPPTDSDAPPRRRVSVAPMMDWTDRHDRYLLRLISRHTLLYSEMIPAAALLHGDRDRYLAFDPFEQPVALQIGGSDPKKMAFCARLGEDHGYREINMNVGCPSDRVQAGRFGACLMLQPQRVADCVHAMSQAVRVPVTVKCRIGVDDRDSFEDLRAFVRIVSAAGCGVFIVHARKAWLRGLNPRQNRRVPVLRHDTVHALKRELPRLTVVTNGGITSLDEVERQLTRVDGVMIGREAYGNPYVLADVDRRFYADPRPPRSRRRVLEAYIDYCARQVDAGFALHRLTRHVLGLFHGQPRARRWRRYLSEHVRRSGADVELLRAAAALALSPHPVSIRQ